MKADLPNLLIAGLPKAGSTSLFWYLSQHPQVCPSAVKEVNYFTVLRQPGAALGPLDAYRRQFSGCGNEPYRMEASPGYALGGTPVIEAIRRHLDRPRIIIIVRDPVKRLWSAYTFQKARGNLNDVSSFEHFVAACERERRAGTDTLPGNRFAALSMGLYADYMSAWLDVFGSDLKVLFSELLFEDPRTTMLELCVWLDIDRDPLDDIDYRPRMKTLQTGSLQLDRMGYAVKRLSKRLRYGERVRSVMAAAQDKLNRRTHFEVLRPETVRRLEQIYHASNIELAERLQAHGYDRFPDWLSAHVRG